MTQDARHAGTMRSIVHPGPRAEPRHQAVPCRVARRRVVLRGGQTLHDAVIAALEENDVTAAYLELANTTLSTLRYVIPGHDASGEHAAWYSATHELTPPARLLRAGLHVGRRDGAPFLHCHGLWEGADGAQAMGHLLPTESRLAEDSEASCLVVEDALLEVAPDAETRFSLFAPRGEGPASASSNALLFTLKPNQDLTEAVEALAERHGLIDARLSGLGSLVGTTFTQGEVIESHATEVLILEGRLEDGKAHIELASVGIDGQHRKGQLVPGGNAVCVTAELLLHQ
ncbi:PCC domain-containing protein [Halomonas urumqiensis]|uniref:DUF296 domain-containing protein n=1 Tax=Halomonas urumqiensis TaxID=1684789 RepID=A0A2N7UMH2_9GAMM|nr:DUF296 domain-containing protein [Halomonas urumqiensis]PMR81626.1 DUF296 domain-containing protein [Halomonas urumqiensis]PTB02263.1 DUF296 domain-containing protein [Halomonas urumqiensis]GHE21731.1 DUF296 domain-containing protein [Halomonas urumqiensis]